MVKTIKVSGIAIREGVSRNGIHYSAEELDKFTPTLKGKPILKDHNAVTDNVIGKVSESGSNESGKSVSYVGWIKEDGTGVTDKIQDGRISEVSIGAVCGQLLKESEDSETLYAKNMTALELSLTPTPGVIGTSITQSFDRFDSKDIDEAVNDFIITTESNKMVESHSMEKSNDNQKIKGGSKMETQEVKNEVVSLNESAIKEAFELKAKLAESEKMIAGMKETQRLEAISTYKGLCESKKVSSKDMSNMSMETIKALTEVIASLADFKEVAQTKSVEMPIKAKESVDWSGYTTESSSLGGMSFYKNY